MKPIVAYVSIHLILLHTLVFANLDQELRKSIDKVMKCQYHEPPKGPVMAVTPARFSQVVVILHQKFNTPSCGRAPKPPIKVNDERTWPFCTFGKCFQGKCECAGGFTGPKCGTYTKKCWLMYCYLTSCHPAHQSLHCVCDPSLYGTQIVTGIYWYDEGKSSKYVPPPPGWEDEPGSMIKLGNDPAIRLGAARPNQNAGRGSSVQSSGRASSGQSSGRASKKQGLSGLARKQGSSSNSFTGQKAASANQKFNAESIPGIDSGSRNRNEEGTGGKEKIATAKSDIEEALDELEELSSSMLKAFPIYLLLMFVFSIQRLQRIYFM